jgi:hypothetical protein
LLPGTYNLASLSPVIVNTTENVLTHFSPQARECYTDEEFYFKLLKWEDGFRYSFKNCLYAGLLDAIISNCSCIPDYFAYLEYEINGCLPCRYYCNTDTDTTF